MLVDILATVTPLALEGLAALTVALSVERRAVDLLMAPRGQHRA